MRIRLPKRLTSLAGAVLIRILGSTWRIRVTGGERLEKARSLTGSVIFAFWHGRLLVLTWTHRNLGIQVLASENYDGDLMGRIIERLGYGHLKGSTSRGGARAVRELRKVISDGLDVGLAVDGPRGPRGRVQQGATELGRLSGAAVIPLSSSADRRWLLGSWDRFQIPAPFAEVLLEYGEPIVIPPHAGPEERERSRRALESALGEITAALDRKTGHSGEEIWPHGDS